MANNNLYIDQIMREIIPSTIEILSLENRINEYLMLSLRTIWGADLNYIESNFSSSIKTELIEKAKTQIDKNWLIIENEKLKITKTGKLMADKISSELFF